MAHAIRFQTTLLQATEELFAFVRLPEDASQALPSRGMVSVEGTADGHPFAVTLEPDGQGGHWFRVDQKLALSVGSTVDFEIAPVSVEPEPVVPEDLLQALERAPAKAQATWDSTTAVARRDWIQWIVSGKKAETRALRIEKACDMLASGKRRVCCFDRSGMYSKSLSCPVAEGESI